jgi:hypothetical protein
MRQGAPEAGLIPASAQASREPPLPGAAATLTEPVRAATPEFLATAEPRLVPGPHQASAQDRSGIAAALRTLLDARPPNAAAGEVPVASAEARTPAMEGDSPARPTTEFAGSGVTVHIGEIVVAPEPRGGPPASAPRPAWQPPVSLADYRASRARQWR